MTDKHGIVARWLAEAWQWSIFLSVISFGLWVAAIIAVVYAVADHSWWYPGGLALAAFVCTVLVQVLRVCVTGAICLQTIAGFDAPQGPPIAPGGGK